MVRFEHISAFYLLMLIPVLILGFILYRRWQKKSRLKWSELHLQGNLFKDFSAVRPIVKFVLFLIGIIWVIIGIANLQFGSKLVEGKSKGIEIMVALDVSKSMLAEDLQPNRLKHAKRAINKLIDDLKGDQIGVVVFAGQAYVQLPITTDYAAARSFIQTITPGMIPVQGTSFKSAIETSLAAFKPNSTANKALIIITDGENHEEGAIEAAEMANEEGVKVFTLGLGTTKGVPVPKYSGNTKSGYLKDKNGNTVMSKMDPKILSEIAEAGGGKFLQARNTQESLSMLFNELKQIEKKELSSKTYMDYEDRFQFFIGPGIFFLLLSWLIFERKTQWLK